MAFFYFYPMISEEYHSLKYKTLQHFWGHQEFRDPQEHIIDAIIANRDTLALLPTGAGKSLCYQLPALILQGTCLVISPLVALMRDQVHQLKKKGIDAEYLSSELDEEETETIYNQCKDGLIKLLYISPERLTHPLFLQNIEEIEISFIAVDEAHCISEWGQDFRPSYQNIKTFKEQFRDVPCLALTATATPKVLTEIQEKLGLKNTLIFQKSFKRDNLRIVTDNATDRYKYIKDFLASKGSGSGIIYARTRKETEELTRFLKSKGFNNVDFFHAGLSAKDKNYRQTQWIASDHRTLISTNAFGMGIDKNNARFIIHFSPPASLENYYQEIGRAGRDGQLSHTIILWNEQELQNYDQLLTQQTPNKKEFVQIVAFLYSIFQVADGELPQPIFQLRIEHLKKLTQCSAAKIKNVLNFLHNQELIFLNDYKSLSLLELKINTEDIELLPQKDAYFIELLLRNLAGLSSHKVHFSEAALSSKLQSAPLYLKERMIDLKKQNIIDYIDGSSPSIRFLKPRNHRLIESLYWKLFEQIQRNKIQKWEEMKYFLKEDNICKMRLILAYFGEKKSENCGQCSVCKQQEVSFFGNHISDEILQFLRQSPATIEQIYFHLGLHKREDIMEQLIELLNAEQIKMLDYRTYTLAQ